MTDRSLDNRFVRIGFVIDAFYRACMNLRANKHSDRERCQVPEESVETQRVRFIVHGLHTESCGKVQPCQLGGVAAGQSLNAHHQNRNPVLLVERVERFLNRFMLRKTNRRIDLRIAFASIG